MGEMTPEQERALSLARARRRRAEAEAQPAATAAVAAPEAASSPRLPFWQKAAATVDKTVESMTGGLLGDEAAAWIESRVLGRGDYDDRLAANRGRQAQLEEQNPGLALGADITGALLPMGGVGMAGKGMGLLSRMALSGVSGAGQGGLYGFMEGEGAEDRLSDAGRTAMIGGGIGFAVPGVTSAVRSVAGPILEPAKAALGVGNARRASRAIGEAVESSGKTRAQIEAEIAQALADGQPEFVLADALGHPGQRQMSSLARRPGPGRTEIVDFLEGRQLNQGDRLAGFIGDSFGFRGKSVEPGTAIVPQGHKFLDTPSDVLSRPQRSAAQTTKALTAARGASADVAYSAAREGADAVDVRGALAAIDDRLGPMANDAGVTGGPIDAKLAGFRKRLAGDGAELSDFGRVLDVKKDIQDAIGEATRAGRNNEARLLGRVATELDAALENASTGYRKANDEFARASRVIDAVDEGSDMASPRRRASDTTARFASMTPDQQAAARIGYGDRQLAGIEAAAGPYTNRARPFTSNKSMQERAAMALDPERLERRIQRENVMFETRRQAIGGSQTADNLADNASGVDASAVVNILSGNFGAGLRQVLTAASQMTKGQNKETRQIIARALMARDPQAVLTEATKRTNSDQTRRAIVDALLSAAGQKAGYLASQNP